MAKLWNIVYVFVLFNSDIALPLQRSELEEDIVDSLEDDDADEGSEVDGLRHTEMVSIETKPRS